MTRIAEIVHGWLGWCPMAAGAQKQEEGDRPALSKAGSEEAGPVARRAVLFSQLTYAVVGLSWLVALAALPYLPETVPIHWNLYGEADGFAGRFIGAFALPAIMTLTLILLVVLPCFVDRIRQGSDNSRDIYAIITFATVSLLLGIEIATLLSSSGMDLPMGTVFSVLLGFFFTIAGGLMPYLRRNTTAGIRLPWTIRSERVWDETHRHGSPLFVTAGVLMVLVGIVAGMWGMLLSFGIIIVTILYITIWSYRLSHTVPDDMNPTKDP